jgi:hypothetical protein
LGRRISVRRLGNHMPERTIDVGGQAYEIQVYCLAESFWLAVGDFFGAAQNTGKHCAKSRNGLAQSCRARAHLREHQRREITRGNHANHPIAAQTKKDRCVYGTGSGPSYVQPSGPTFGTSTAREGKRRKASAPALCCRSHLRRLVGHPFVVSGVKFASGHKRTLAAGHALFESPTSRRRASRNPPGLGFLDPGARQQSSPQVSA